MYSHPARHKETNVEVGARRRVDEVQVGAAGPILHKTNVLMRNSKQASQSLSTGSRARHENDENGMRCDGEVGRSLHVGNATFAFLARCNRLVITFVSRKLSHAFHISRRAFVSRSSIPVTAKCNHFLIRHPEVLPLRRRLINER